MSFNHTYTCWRDVLASLSVSGPLGGSYVGSLDAEGRLISFEGSTSAQETSEEEGEDQLISWVTPAYQASIRSWLSERSRDTLIQDPDPTLSTNSVSFPVIHPITQHESWLCLTLLGAEDHGWSFSLVEVSSRRHQERMAARAAGLINLRHDLANQLFLFKALPELTAFSSPEELIEDVTESASGLLKFIDARLNSSWISALQPAPVTGAEAIIETLKHWAGQSSLDRERWRFSFDDTLFGATSSNIDPPTLNCLDIQWSLSQLASLLKRSLIKGAAPDALISVKLIACPPQRDQVGGARVGICGQLASREPRYALSVSVEGWSPREAIASWRVGRGWSNDWSNLRAAQESPDEALAAWFGSWVSAAHQTGGVVELGEVPSGEVQPRSESVSALFICI